MLTICVICNKPIIQNDEIEYIIEQNVRQKVHSDYYFRDISDAMEQHPIFNPHR